MTKTNRGERTSGEILAAAQELLLESGIEQLSLRAVARRAGLAPSAVYNHFEDKDSIVLALALQSVRSLASSLEQVPEGPAIERLRSLGRAYCSFATERPQEYRVIFDCLVNPPHMWEQYAIVADPFSRIVETCTQGLGEGTLVDRHSVGPSGMAFALWTLVDGYAHLRAKHLSAVEGPFETMLEGALDALLTGFSATEADCSSHVSQTTKEGSSS